MSPANAKLTFAFGVVLVFVLGVRDGEASPIAAAQHSSITPNKVTYEVVINDIIDKNMDAIRKFTSQLDPLDMKDSEFKITNSLFMKLHTGWLQNLSHIRRDTTTNCTLKYSDKVMTVDLNFAWDDLALDYRYLLKMFMFSRQGDLHGQLYDLKVFIRVDVDLENYQIILRKIVFLHSSKMELLLEGHPVDHLFNLVIKIVTTFCKKLVLTAINYESAEMLQLNIANINEKLSSVVHHEHKYSIEDLLKSVSHVSFT